MEIHPWDISSTIENRIFLQYGPLVEFHARQEPNDYQIIDWENKLSKFSKEDSLSSVLKAFRDEEDPTKVLKKHLKRLWIAKELDEDTWNDLFQYEMELKGKWDWTTFLETMKKEEVEDRNRILEAEKFEKVSKKLESQKKSEIFLWKSGLHQMRYKIKDDRPLGQVFQQILLNPKDNWILATLRSNDPQENLAKINRRKDADVQDLLDKNIPLLSDEPGIFLFSKSSNLPVLIRKEKPSETLIEIEFIDAKFWEDTLVALRLENAKISQKKDIGLLGEYKHQELFVEFPLFQDLCLNDPLLQTFLFVDESRRASFEATLWLTFTPYFRELLGVESHPTDLYLKNIHRQAGFLCSVTITSPIPESKIELFLDIMQRLMGRYEQVQPKLLEEYEKWLPEIGEMFEKQKRDLVKNVKKQRSEYFLKYPRMFVTNLYSLKCQKPSQPVLLDDEDTAGLDPSRYIRFPPNPMAEFQPENYFCPSEEYPYAGLKEFKGKKVVINYVPCCFKSPQDEDNIEKLAELKLLDDGGGAGEGEEEEDTTANRKKMSKKKLYVVKHNLLIKTPEQLGRLNYPSIKRFLLAYDPFSQYFRMGIVQDANALLSCMLTMRKKMGYEQNPSVEQIRNQMSGDPEIIHACIQDNPGISIEQLQEDMSNMNVYFDPRRFLRAVEIYFNVRLIVFSKGKKDGDASLIQPLSMRSHASLSLEPPYVVLFEHWGGKTDIASEAAHPHCELISYLPHGEEKLKFYFKHQLVFNVLKHLMFQFDGNRPVYPFDMKHFPLLPFLEAQTPDGMGKIRMLHFRYNGILLSGTVKPMPVLTGIPFLFLENQEEVPVLQVLPFLSKFDSWKQIQVPNPAEPLVLWTVSQPNVFWKNKKEQQSLEATFRIRLPAPRKKEIESMAPRNRICINPNQGLYLFTHPDDWLTPEIYNEKRARCLDYITTFVFSLYLHENKMIQKKALDPDVILDSFFRRCVSLRPKEPSFIELNLVKSYYQEEKLLIPSLDVWKKLHYNLKWKMFYKFESLVDLCKKGSLEDGFFTHLSDFVLSDFKHYYCHFTELSPVLQNAIEERYELQSEPLETLTPKQFWYNPDQSPYPFPSIVVKYPSLEIALKSAKFRIKHGWIPETVSSEEEDEDTIDISHYEFDKDQKKWLLQGEHKGSEKVFTFTREKDCLVLFKN